MVDVKCDAAVIEKKRDDDNVVVVRGVLAWYHVAGWIFRLALRIVQLGRAADAAALNTCRIIGIEFRWNRQ